MPTPRKSLTELAQTGTLSKHLGRYEARIASRTTVIAPIGKPPTHLPAIERSIWGEIVRTAPPGLLTKSDRLSLEILGKLVARMRTSEFKVSELNALVAVLGKFGMTPADRLKMNLEPPPEPAAQSEQDARWAELDELD
jgi:hypothetical protein